MNELPAKARIVFRARLSELADVAAAVEAFAEARDVPRAAADDLNLCLDEILSNVVTHGLQQQGDASVSVDLSLEGGVLAAVIEDDGPPFDPTQAPEPDLTGGIRERRMGGVGLMFVRRLMDEMIYTRENHRNRLRIEKKIAGAGE